MYVYIHMYMYTCIYEHRIKTYVYTCIDVYTCMYHVMYQCACLYTGTDELDLTFFAVFGPQESVVQPLTSGNLLRF